MDAAKLVSDYWPYLLIPAIAGAAWLVRELRSRAAQSWPVVEGTVEMHTVRVEGYGRSEHEIAEVNYSYRVQGEFYSGAHVVGGESDFDAFPKLSRVFVHYKPSDPTVSFLDREDIRAKKRMVSVS